MRGARECPRPNRSPDVNTGDTIAIHEVDEEIAKRRAELAAEQRRMANFVDFIGEGRQPGAREGARSE